MSTTSQELRIDIDELDRKAAEKAANGADKGAPGAKKDDKVIDPDPIEVIEAPAATPTVAKTTLTPDEGLEKLKKQLADEQTARANAERTAREASEAELRARTEVHGTQIDLVNNALTQATENKATLKARYAAALAAQDYDGAADVQLAMSENAANLLMFQKAKKDLETAPKPQPRAAVDPVERVAAQLTPRSAAWVRAHPEFVRDQNKYNQMVAADGLAHARGNVRDSDEYFREIEKILDITDPAAGRVTHVDDEDPTALAAQQAPVQRRAPPAAAPVSRSGNGAGNRSNVVTLTVQEVEIAEMMQMTPEEYARNKVSLVREGKIGKPN